MVPEQEVPDELVVTEVASICSEKVTEMDEVNDTDVVPFDGLVDATVGEVVWCAGPTTTALLLLQWGARFKKRPF